LISPNIHGFAVGHSIILIRNKKITLNNNLHITAARFYFYFYFTGRIGAA